MASSEIPTADLSPFLREEEDEDEDGKKKAIEIIGKACSEYGFFQVVNHGVPVELMNRALLGSKEFFGYPLDTKLAFSPQPAAPLPAGYGHPPEISSDKKEFFMMAPPHYSTFNVFPSNPKGFSEAMKELFPWFVKIGSIVESIINDCLGLPPNFLSEYNIDRKWDLMVAFRYPPAASEVENVGVSEHKDVDCITFVLQDEVGGLEVKKDGRWIPIAPNPNTLVVNLGDVIQVLSNDRYRSASHRVVRQAGRERYSYAFAYNIGGETWVEPLPHFTKNIDEPPKYRGFLYKDYIKLRLRNRTHPPSRPQDSIDISHYSTDSS